MPLQNRVTPTAEIVAHPARGLMMGNRGCLHDADRRLGTARWRSKLWICCVTDFRGWKRDPMPPGRWTALFFLDEATALAAGHRPCAECLRGRFNEFRAAWGDERIRATELDATLHVERLTADGRQATHRARLADLPDGVIVAIAGEPHLWRADALHPWSFAGYGPPRPADDGEVTVLTPPSSVRAIAAGFAPAYFGA
jgi:hypothetical protein